LFNRDKGRKGLKIKDEGLRGKAKRQASGVRLQESRGKVF
jgi:hypothetical protein